MQKGHEETQQWLRISAQVLEEEHGRLQPRILEIYKNNPGLCSYATDLAQLRMSGPSMENRLIRILAAKSVESIDLIVNEATLRHPAERAFLFFADLVKNDLKNPATIH